MVRRRATKAATFSNAGAQGANRNLLENGEMKATVGYGNLEEQYFASPKRKDCKIENCSMGTLPVNEQKVEKEFKMHGKMKSSVITCKAKGERGGIAGRVIGVPLATRSQTRTIENFFKAKTATKNTEWQQDVQITAENAVSGITETRADQDEPQFNGNVQPPSPALARDIDEDTNDTDYSTELTNEAAFGGDFLSYRSQLRDSHSSTGSASTNGSNTDNIFLQEPVLRLNVDKTPNQVTSIKINTSLQVESIFSSPPTLTSVLNGRFNQIVSLNAKTISPLQRNGDGDLQNMGIVFNKDNKTTELVPDQSNDNDNSSCDSGVAFTTSLNNDLLQAAQQEVNVALAAGAQSGNRKPATPHRILCPSPIKTTSPTHTIAAGRVSSPTGRKINKEQLSPRKSQRQTAVINSKSRRRLNQPKEFSALHADKEQEKLLNGYANFMNYNKDTEVGKNEDLNYENLETVDLCDVFTAQHKCTSNAQDSTKQPQNATKTNVAKMRPSKSKLQGGLPLVTTNGNRELTEFFPIRRSVRKTKTAVKEEMMRNLEKAILEECAEGLKVSHFEGKGRGVVADRHFQRGEFVVEYVGDLISMTEAAEREKRYALDENAGCYMYYFKHKNQQYCIDATADTGKLGRLVNHSRNGNLVTKVVVVKQRPHLILIAKEVIEPGEELTYDYGDRSKESLLHHPWLAF